MQNPMAQDSVFHILSLDGGGARGIYPAQVLANIERELSAPVKECFDLIVGTSTGSIVGGAAAVGIPMAEIVTTLRRRGAGHLSQETPWRILFPKQVFEVPARTNR